MSKGNWTKATRQRHKAHKNLSAVPVLAEPTDGGRLVSGLGGEARESTTDKRGSVGCELPDSLDSRGGRQPSYEYWRYKSHPAIQPDEVINDWNTAGKDRWRFVGIDTEGFNVFCREVMP